MQRTDSVNQRLLHSLLESTDLNLRQEFQSIELESQTTVRLAPPAQTAAKDPRNVSRNRYKDILPYDKSRVPMDDEEENDYINASFIKNAENQKFVIASQAPLPGTIEHFWRMCGFHNIQMLVMLCDFVEGGKNKCAKYLPVDKGETLETERFSILTEERINKFDDLIVRSLRVTRKDGGEEKWMTHVQYSGWPDHGVSDNLVKIRCLLDTIQDFHTSQSPTLVHCSAGCGRTGTVVGIMYVQHLIKHQMLTCDFNIPDMVLELRMQRQNLVQTQSQYSFLVQFVCDVLLQDKVSRAERVKEAKKEERSLAPSTDEKPPAKDTNSPTFCTNPLNLLTSHDEIEKFNRDFPPVPFDEESSDVPTIVLHSNNPFREDLCSPPTTSVKVAAAAERCSSVSPRVPRRQPIPDRKLVRGAPVCGSRPEGEGRECQYIELANCSSGHRPETTRSHEDLLGASGSGGANSRPTWLEVPEGIKSAQSHDDISPKKSRKKGTKMERANRKITQFISDTDLAVDGLKDRFKTIVTS